MDASISKTLELYLKAKTLQILSEDPMNTPNQNQENLLQTLVTAIQTCIYNYPTYNYLTQVQNTLRLDLSEKSNNPLIKKGQKYFSQNDEDGILLEIL